MTKNFTKKLVKWSLREVLASFKVQVFMLLCMISVTSFSQNCIWGSQSPAGTINVSSNSQTIVGFNVFPGTYSVENFTVAGQYALAASFGSYFTVTDNANNPIISGSNTLTVTIPTAGLYRIHLSSNGSCGTSGGGRIVALAPLNRALNFDGVNDNVNLGTSIGNALAGTNKITIEAWVKPITITGPYRIIVGNYSTPANQMQFCIRQQGTGYCLFIGNGSSGSYSSVLAANTVTTAIWQHVAGTWDGSVARIYVNGVLSNTVSITYPSLGATTNSVIIGTNAVPEPWSGDIDEVRIWNRALCQGEIQNNMNGEISTTSTNLLANYHFNQGVASGTNTSITSLTDDSGNSNTGTLANFALTGSTSNLIAPGAFGDGNYVTAFVSPTVSISGANVICNGASTIFTASGNVTSYSWISGPTTSTNSVSPTTTTTYSVVGTNSLGCQSNIATKTLTVSTISTSTAVTNVACNGGLNGVASITASGGVGAYSYLWSNGGTTSTITALMAGVYTATVTDANSCTSIKSATVTQPSALVTTTAFTNVACNGGSNGVASITASGGVGAYSYLWSNGGTTSTITALMAGVYTATVTDANSCTSIKSATVTQPTVLSLSASASSATICSGNSSTLTANATGGTGAIIYTWVSGPTSSVSVVSPTSTSVYTVNVTDANSCAQSATVSVIANSCAAAEALNFDGSNDVVKLGIAITNTLTGTNKITVEAWVNPSTNSGIGLIAGNHATSGGSTQFFLRRNGNQYDFAINNGSGTTVIGGNVSLNTWQHVAGVWNGNTVTLYVNGISVGSTTTSIGNFNLTTSEVWLGYNAFNEGFTGAVDEVRIWNLARTQCEINTYKNCEIPTTATNLLANYHFNQGFNAGTNTGVTTLTDASASAYTGTLTSMALTGTTSNWIAPGGVVSGNSTPANTTPTVIVNSGAICSGESFTMTPSGADMFTYSGGTNVVTPTADATYTVTGTDAVTSCSNIAISSVTVNALPVITSQSGNVTLCGDVSSTHSVSVSGTNTYEWYYTEIGGSDEGVIDGSFTEINYTTNVMTIQQVLTGDYNGYGVYCIITNSNNCSVTSLIDTIVANPLPTILVNSGVICVGQSFTMIPSGADTYTYSSGTDVVVPTADATYTVSGTETLTGCTNSVESTVTVNALPVVMATTNNTLLCTGETAILSVSGASTYTWSTTDNTTNIAVTPTVQTTYTVDGTDSNGCSNTTTIMQDVSLCTGIVALSNNNSIINVYPNPSNGLFVLELTTLSKVTVSNALGQVVFSETFESGKHNLDIQNESIGVYFVKVIENNKQQTVKIIKQ